MFDIEKMMKPVFEKHIPALLVQFEKNKKRDWIMARVLEFPIRSKLPEGILEEDVLRYKIAYLNDAYIEALSEMKAQGIIE